MDAAKLSLADSAYEGIMQRILDGRYAEGSYLSIVRVAEELGMSRTPVHNALQKLGTDSFVSHEHNKQARVARFSVDDLFEVYEMRKILEGPAAEYAARRVDRRQLAPLRATAADLRAHLGAPDWINRWVEADDRFHRTIAEASGFPRLCADICRYRALHRCFNRMAVESQELHQAMEEHEAILEALERHDGALARERMIAHLSTWQDFFVLRLQAPRRSPLGQA
ncbi:MAG: GntR family transcriptional regulator [Gammaproteobacteria bacterium]|nr:GntR family transcriptional regulator [Verrucomicrobiota bacterium]MBM4221650.1 GntR family transcriptional regulator [Gammaproteobacteria bacterium]